MRMFEKLCKKNAKKMEYFQTEKFISRKCMIPVSADVKIGKLDPFMSTDVESSVFDTSIRAEYCIFREYVGA